MARIVEAQPIDQRAIAHEAEHARARVALLRERRHGAHFGMAEAHAEQAVGHAGVLVEAGGDAERVGEFEAPQGQAEAGVVARPRARIEPRLQRRQGQGVSPLGVEGEQQRAGEVVEGRHRWSAAYSYRAINTMGRRM